MDHNAGPVDRADLVQAWRQAHGIKGRPDKIIELATDIAKKVVVAETENLIACLAGHGFQPV
jgi:poly(3-hydroxybutyrate) depolymerase